MRDILFRAKTNYNDECVVDKWVYGLPIHNNDEGVIEGIVTQDCVGRWIRYCPIDINTLGKYTGLKDKNGKKIFEGDIVRHYYSRNRSMFTIGKVLFDDKNCKFTNKEIDSPYEWDMHQGCVYEVVGNIHDNPELLESEA